jgi:ABC-type antimicrobial peptide transport system, permease component
MDTLRIAAGALAAHKLRSFLTLLGVIIGVMTVISVVSIIAGLNDYIAEKVFTLSPDVYVVTQFGIITSQKQFLEAVKRKKIDWNDYEAIREHCTRCAAVGAQETNRLTVKRGAQKLSGVRVQGGTANIGEISNVDIEEGRFFTISEQDHAAMVTVIGSDVKDELFGKLDPIGRTVRIGSQPARVIGLLRKQGSVLGRSQDSQLFMPLAAYRKAFGTKGSIDLYIRAAGGVPGLEGSLDQVRVLIRSRRRTSFRADDPFGVVSAEALQALWKSISAGGFALMIFISGISLVVGGIVITNIMLVSVVERTREIGIRRALGARKRNIQFQFLTEAILLSLGGGIVGVLLGVLISFGISVAFPLPTLVRPSLVVSGLMVAVITGVAAGYFPARRAANLPPIDALRAD